MKHIVKRPEPPSLTRHRQQPHATYENYAQKADLRRSLLQEQGKICCYCMQRIEDAKMKIEHWASQRRHPHRQLEYQNLLGACEGGEGAPKHLQHCDTHKGEDDISVHPADPAHNCEALIKYQADGVIYAGDTRINNDLDVVLNLNLQRLCNNRKAALEGALASLRRRRPDGAWTRTYLQTEKDRWNARDGSDQLPEYCQIVIYHLQKRIAQSR